MNAADRRPCRPCRPLRTRHVFDCSNYAALRQPAGKHSVHAAGEARSVGAVHATRHAVWVAALQNVTDKLGVFHNSGNGGPILVVAK